MADVEHLLRQAAASVGQEALGDRIAALRNEANGAGATDLDGDDSDDDGPWEHARPCRSRPVSAESSTS